ARAGADRWRRHAKGRAGKRRLGERRASVADRWAVARGGSAGARVARAAAGVQPIVLDQQAIAELRQLVGQELVETDDVSRRWFLSWHCSRRAPRKRT